VENDRLVYVRLYNYRHKSVTVAWTVAYDTPVCDESAAAWVAYAAIVALYIIIVIILQHVPCDIKYFFSYDNT